MLDDELPPEGLSSSLSLLQDVKVNIVAATKSSAVSFLKFFIVVQFFIIYPLADEFNLTVFHFRNIYYFTTSFMV